MDTIRIRPSPDADKIEEIIDRAHSYEIYEEGIGRYRFVDRDNEIRKILESSEYLFLGGRVSYPAFKGGASCFIAPPCP